MNKILKFSFLLVMFSLCFAIADVDAQNYGKKRKKKKKPAKTEKSAKTDDYFDESGNFASHLWYGGGLNLSYCSPSFSLSLFGGGCYLSPYSSTFTIGISPMVGYKIIGGLSAGPVLGIQYNYLKGTGSDLNIHTADAISYSGGLFARYKFLRTLFVHTEYRIESNEYVYYDASGYIAVHPITREVYTTRESQDNFYLGIGYNSGGELLAVELYLLNNFIKSPYDNPNDILKLSLRVGITYKF